jgi:hypothetical protein
MTTLIDDISGLKNRDKEEEEEGENFNFTCLVPPPNIFRKYFARSMNFLDPTIMLPIGAPSPFAKQILILSKQAQYSFKSTPSAATASKRRAPSRCMATGFSPSDTGKFRTKSEISLASLSGRTVPLKEFSSETTRVGGKWTIGLG